MFDDGQMGGCVVWWKDGDGRATRGEGRGR